jgi:uncharacterized protein YneF (UPF0154 family)
LGGLLNSQYLFLIVGLALGLYLGNKTVRQKVHTFIDRYIIKKSSPPKVPPANTEAKKTIIINGKKYSEDNTQDNGRNT